MSDNTKRTAPCDKTTERGLGRVVYGGDAEPRGADKADAAALVTEASEESFPASDPPNYTVGNPKRATTPEPAPPATDSKKKPRTSS